MKASLIIIGVIVIVFVVVVVLFFFISRQIKFDAIRYDRLNVKLNPENVSKCYMVANLFQHYCCYGWCVRLFIQS